MTNKSPEELAAEITHNHYENFPVGSVLFPKHIRQDVFNIYAYSRTADDIVDDENISLDERKLSLQKYRSDFISKKFETFPFFESVWSSIEKHKLSLSLFIDLLDAFEQDLNVDSYNTFEEIEKYASKSANPVGRLLLELNGQRDEKIMLLSDKICTGLQFINFWQDISRDKLLKRYYVPKEVLSKHSLNLTEFYYPENLTHAHDLVLNELLLYTRNNFERGYKLFNHLSGRFKLEIKLTWYGGEKILQETENLKSLLIFQRPILKKSDYFSLILKAFFR